MLLPQKNTGLSSLDCEQEIYIKFSCFKEEEEEEVRLNRKKRKEKEKERNNNSNRKKQGRKDDRRNDSTVKRLTSASVKWNILLSLNDFHFPLIFFEMTTAFIIMIVKCNNYSSFYGSTKGNPLTLPSPTYSCQLQQGKIVSFRIVSGHPSSRRD